MPIKLGPASWKREGKVHNSPGQEGHEWEKLAPLLKWSQVNKGQQMSPFPMGNWSSAIQALKTDAKVCKAEVNTQVQVKLAG